MLEMLLACIVVGTCAPTAWPVGVALPGWLSAGLEQAWGQHGVRGSDAD